MFFKRFLHFLAILIIVCVFISACAPRAKVVPTIPPATSTAQINKPPIAVVTVTPSLTGVHIGEAVPSFLREQAAAWEIPANSYLSFDVSTSPFTGEETHLQWVYALVAPFPTILDGVTSDELKSAWRDGTPPAAFDGKPLLMDESTLAAFTALWGEPASGFVRSVPAGELLDTAWMELPSWAIIPFESLQPKWKVLTVDGQSPIRKGFDLSSYTLVVPFSLRTSSDLPPSSFVVPLSNYDPSKMTTIIMTGVTALVRATALTMELKGVAYPGERIRDVMLEADIAHISNEIPFFTGCPYPKPDQAALVFCSDPKYIELFTDIGADVIELTGNHFADRGAQGMIETIEIYKANKLPYFGGGIDREDSIKPALFESNGNKIAFIGCNRPDTGKFPTATADRPGAAPCDFTYLKEKIAQLKADGYIVISTFQWNESYDFKPNILQVQDFRLMVDAGADIVSGSQAHYAQSMEFYNNSFIHYGLGNLFFDQMGDQSWMPKDIRREFLDRYVIYDGRLIGIELLTAMLEDYARPRWMTGQERANFLQDYFYYSGWLPFQPTPEPTITPTLTPLPIPPLAGTPEWIPSNTPGPSP